MKNSFLPPEFAEENFLIAMLNNYHKIKEYPLNNPKNFETVQELARRHGILPQLYHYSTDTEIDLSDDIISSLKNKYLKMVSADLMLAAHLLKVTRALEEKGFRYIAIKGPALAQEIYGDITLRQYSDIDLLVDQDKMKEISRIIISLGYQAILPLSLLERRKFFELDNDFSFLHSSTGARLELHWKLFPERHKMPLSFSELYHNSGRLVLQNREITILSPEDNLLYLSLHGAKHIFERLEWVHDLDRLIRHYTTLDPAKAYQNAVDIEVEESFLLGIFLSQRLFDTPLPKELQNYRSPQTDLLIEKTMHYYQEGFVFWEESAKKYARFLFLADLHQKKVSKYLSLFNSLFKPTPVDVITFNLSDKWDFLYPLLRPFRLLFKYLFRAGQP